MFGCQPSTFTHLSMHHQKSSSDSPFQAKTGNPEKTEQRKTIKAEKRVEPKFWQEDAGFPQFQTLLFCCTPWIDFLHSLVLSLAPLSTPLSLGVILLLLDQRGQTKGTRGWWTLNIWLKQKKEETRNKFFFIYSNWNFHHFPITLWCFLLLCFSHPILFIRKTPRLFSIC